MWLVCRTATGRRFAVIPEEMTAATLVEMVLEEERRDSFSTLQTFVPSIYPRQAAKALQGITTGTHVKIQQSSNKYVYR
jgi:hypothetical protein